MHELIDDIADGWFGASVAADYDTDEGIEFDPDEIGRTVDVLADLAGDGSSVEFAIGTGRIAIPLAARGVRVHGIELSRAMAARLASKPGAEVIDVTIGDITVTRIEGEFSLAYLVFNTINNLTTQAAQVDCFRNAAAHLSPGGRFVVEVGVPALRRMPPGQDIVPFTACADDAGNGTVGFDRYDVVTQQFSSHHVSVTNGAGRYRAIPFRYVWPSELDLMATIAGLELEHRWQDWARTLFTADSDKHVSVWVKPTD
ncbi:MAG: class I SAM-dependent methyltransferase [Ilumatobacteraceae bacterium]